MNIKSIRIELQILALELEKVEFNKVGSVPDPVIINLENLLRDIKLITGRKL